MQNAFNHTIPISLPHEIQRTDLLSLLSSHPFRLIALLAPSGFGKTTLLSQYARLSPSPFWLSLSDDSQDLLFFCSSLLTSLSPLPFPSFSAALSSVNTSSSSLAQAFLSDLDHLPPFQLFLDQIQHLSPSSASFLNILFPKLPPSVLVLLSGYTPHHLNFSQLISKNLALIIDSDHLRFSSKEITHYLSIKNPTLNPSSLSHLDGWPAGLSLHSTSAARFLEPHALIQELLGDILTQFPQLPILSTYPVWTPIVFEEVGLPHHLLDELWRAGHLLVPLSHQEYKPHRILRLFLEELLKKDEEGHRSAHRLAGQRMEKEGKPIEALKHYKNGKEYQDVYRLIRFVFPGYLDRLENGLVYTLFDGLEISVLPVDLFEMYAVSYIYGHPNRSFEKEFLEEALLLLKEAHRKSACHDSVYKELGTIEFYMGNRDKALGWLDTGLSEPHLKNNLTLMRKKLMYLYFEQSSEEKEILIEKILDVTGEQTNMRQKAASWAICGKAYVIDGRQSKGMYLLEKSIEIFEKLDNLNYIVFALDGMLAGWMSLCDWKKARETWRRLNSPGFNISGNSIFASAYLMTIGEFQEALNYARNNKIKAIEFEILAMMGRKDEAKIVYEEIGTMSEYALRRECESIDIRIGIGMYIIGMKEEGLQRIESGIAKAKSEYIKMRGYLYLGRQTKKEYDEILKFDRDILLKIKRNETKNAKNKVRIRTIGAFEIEYEGEKCTTKKKKVQEILVFLIINGKSERNTIINGVWSESDRDWNFEYFSDLIYRLRKVLEAIGIKNGITQHKGHYSVSEEYVWDLDIENIEEYFFETGKWMEMADSEWFETKRYEIRSKIYKNMLKMGNDDVSWLEKAIKYEPMEEQGYRELIGIYKKGGEKIKEEKLRDKMREIWMTEFGIEPDIYDVN